MNEAAAFKTLKGQGAVNAATEAGYAKFLAGLKSGIGPGAKAIATVADATAVYIRNNQPKGPMTVFGYDYFMDHWGSEKTLPGLLSFEGLRGDDESYAYEVLNLVNGQNDIAGIRNQLSAEFGPVPIEIVAEYLAALKTIGVIKLNK